jgi:asparagine synthase (glutamine-hydrolysing)
MSVQFGRWNFDGLAASPEYLAKVRELLAPYGPDGGASHASGGVNVLYSAFHTTKESRREIQPHVAASGAVIVWDGRLDNRAELASEFQGSLAADSTDVAIVSAVYERSGTESLGKLVGDWALSVWNPDERSLILAKDPIGVRQLYYSVEKNVVSWSTVLDPLVLLAGRSFQIEEEYVAGWLSFFPAAHLTPYVGIHSVPPSCFVRLKRGELAVCKYWDFDSTNRIRYRRDAEYEEHFRTVFEEAVRRRLSSETPVLAELSGGMDSSSIVCVADAILARQAETPRLDTLSYYDDSETHWNERAYFTTVEQRRGRSGCHIDIGFPGPSPFDSESDCFRAAPGSGGASAVTEQLRACLASGPNRVILSGIGGDEFTGGVPTPVPEFGDLLTRGQFRRLAHQLNLWALNKRKPWLHLLWETIQPLLPPELTGPSKVRQPAPWLVSRFVRRHEKALAGYENRWKLFGPLPSFQENLSALEGLRRQLGCTTLASDPLSEKRYPFLDRDLLAFVFAIPREQLVRPGQRRSLLRRALAAIVPEVILDRKRKAFVERGPRIGISRRWESLVEASRNMASASYGFIEPAPYLEALDRARRGQDLPIVPMLRTLALESWLRNLGRRNVLRTQESGFALATGSRQQKHPSPLPSPEGFDLS